MSDLSKKARAAAEDKAERLTRSSTGKIDASGWREPLGEKGTIQTGPRPVSRRQFRAGGKVTGSKAVMHAGRKPRASGGLTANSLINRDVKSANAERDGEKHIGGMKKGGRAHKMVGGPMMGRPHPGMPASSPMIAGRPVAPMQRGVRPYAKGGKCAGGATYAEGGRIKSEFAANKAMASTPAKGSAGTDYFAHIARSGTGTKTPNLPLPKKAGGAVQDGTRPAGDRIARASGGRSKKGMNVNIVIAPQGGGARPPMPPIGAAPSPAGIPAPPPQMPPPGAGAPMGPPPVMPRKNGGRTNYPIDTGSGGGLARLEKIKAYGARPA